MATQQTQRPLFFEGQYLSAEDLGAIVEYFRTQAARHLLGGHTWGIAVGLQLQETKTPSNEEIVDVFIKPGYAWDGFGRPIVLQTSYQVPVTKFTSIQFGVDPNTRLPLDGAVKIWLCYDEKPTRDVRKGFEVCDPANPLTRALEGFKVEVGDQEPTHDDVITAGYDLEKAIKDFKFSTLTSTSNSKDDSVPYQMFPETGSTARWLIPLGLVGWQPSSDPDKPGHFKPLAKIKNKGDRNLPLPQESEAMRRYTGWVLSAIVVDKDTIELRNRLGEKLRVSIKNGDLDIEGNVSLFKKGKLYFYDSDNRGKNSAKEEPLYVGREGKSLQAIITGNTEYDKFEIGPVIGENFDAKFFVQGGGAFGAEKTPAKLKLGKSEISTQDTNPETLSIRSGDGVVAFDGDNVMVGIGKGDSPEQKLTIQSDKTETYLNVKNIKMDSNKTEKKEELCVGVKSDEIDKSGKIIQSGGGIIQSNKDLQLQAGDELVIIKANSSSSPPPNILTIENEVSNLQKATNLTNPQPGGDLQFKTTNIPSSGTTPAVPTMRMVIKANGSVGIGNSPPDNIKLYVDGPLHCNGTITGTFSPTNNFPSLTINGPLTVNKTAGQAAIEILTVNDTTGTTINGLLTATKISVGGATTSKDGEVAANSVTVGSDASPGSLEVKGTTGSATFSGQVSAGSVEITGSPKNFKIHDKPTVNTDRFFVCATRVSLTSEADLYWRGKETIPSGAKSSKPISLENFPTLASYNTNTTIQPNITIQLTPIFNPNNDNKMLAASEVDADGKFTVYTIDGNATTTAQAFCYEVKAIMK